MDHSTSTTYSLDVELKLQFPDRWTGTGVKTFQSLVGPHAIKNLELDTDQGTIRVRVVESGENPAAALIKLIRIIEVAGVKSGGEDWGGVIDRAEIQRVHES